MSIASEDGNNPTRLGHPMKRAGERGENKWEQISWEEAYDMIEKRVRKAWETQGPEAIVALEGTGRNVVWQVPLLEYSAFKSPNYGCGFLSGFRRHNPVESLLEVGGRFEDRISPFPRKLFHDAQRKLHCIPRLQLAEAQPLTTATLLAIAPSLSRMRLVYPRKPAQLARPPRSVSRRRLSWNVAMNCSFPKKLHFEQRGA